MDFTDRRQPEAGSLSVEERTRKNLSTILSRLASHGQAKLADGLGLHESTISKMKDGEFDRIAKLLAILGINAVPMEMRCFPQDELHAIFTLAKARMKGMDSINDLSAEY